jgi:hypothetical protein
MDLPWPAARRRSFVLAVSARRRMVMLAIHRGHHCNHETNPPGRSEKQSGADAKELAEFSRLRRADASLPPQSLMHVAALPENGLEVRCRLPGVLPSARHFCRGTPDRALTTCGE